MAPPGSPQVIGRYAVYGKIAQGGMAAVHFGRLQGAAGFSRTVAIKRLHPHLAEEPGFLATIIDEARLAARIHHPNVVPTLDVVSDGGEMLVVMEYVRGESLSRLLRATVDRERQVPLPVASAIALGALHGLHAAHEASSERGEALGIVHRDVSPQNILVGADGVARIIDFGVAKAAVRLQTTREGVIKGKVPYMAPEQLEALEMTRLVDVYAMGVVLWEMLAGRNLFTADGEAGLVGKVLAGASEPPSRHAPNLPAELDALVMKALSRNPADRFASALDMANVLVRVVPPALPHDVGVWVEDLARGALAQRAAALAAIESDTGTTTTTAPGGAHDDVPTVATQPSSLSVETTVPGGAVRRRSRRPLLAGGVAGAMLLVGGVAAVAWWPGRTAAPSEAAAVEPTAAASAPPAAAADPPAAGSSSSGVPAPSSAAAAPTVPSARAVTTGPASRPVGTTKRRPAQASPQASGMVRFSKPD